MNKRPSSPGASLFLHKARHDPRAAALVALSRILAEETDAQEALDQALQAGDMPPSDKSLCTELLYGHLRMRLRLQWFAGRYLRRPEKLPWEMRLCLEQALYSLAFLRMPARAAVHWAVEHVRHRFGQALAGVANGALRAMQRELPLFNDPDLYRRSFAEATDALACRFSMPAWIAGLWRESYGPDICAELLEASSAPPPQGLRLNRAQPGWENLRSQLLNTPPAAQENAPTPAGPAGLVFAHSLPHEARRMIAQGLASRQSGASYAVLEYFAPATWPQPVWDCCSGRGGKTLALLEQGIPVALASDPSRRRLAALPEEYARLKLADPPCPALSHAPAPEAAQKADDFGAILVDAPCSGLGTLARHADIRYRRTPADCEQLAALQKTILDAAWAKLRPAGRLIYITCTANPAENEQQIAAFLEKHPEAALAREYPPEARLRFGEYFYGAMLEKQ